MEANAPLRRLRSSVGEHPRRTAFVGVFPAVICCFIAIGTVLPILPQYVKGPIGAGDVAVGIVVGAFAFTAVIEDSQVETFPLPNGAALITRKHRVYEPMMDVY